MLYKFIFIAFALLIASSMADLDDSSVLITPQFIREINAKNLGWTASQDQGSFINGITVGKMKTYLGAKVGGPVLRTKQDHEFKFSADQLPENFDSRKNWPECPTIGWIRDQSACGSCWAFGASEAISDRYCTYKVNSNMNISAADIAFCCGFSCGDGCNGGFPAAAWQYWVDSGVVPSTCYPYPFPSCDHHIPNSKNPCPSNEYPTPTCPSQCTGTGSWSQQKHYGADAWNVHGETAIMQEIYENGPVETAFQVYSDFPTYKSGVYVQHSNDFLGGHAVKFLGWGVTEGGVKYWIVANSWNKDWGMDGTFWILRGANECGIENTANAGKPKN